MTIIGIDPGSNGGIATFDGIHYNAIKMPPTPKDILDTLKEISDSCNDYHCFLEDVGKGMPKQSSSATATFARHNGHLEMAILALGIPFTKVTPQKWIKALSCGSSKDFASKIAWKNHLKEIAQREFPDEKITLWNSDALLIAKYGYLTVGKR